MNQVTKNILLQYNSLVYIVFFISYD